MLTHMPPRTSPGPASDMTPQAFKSLGCHTVKFYCVFAIQIQVLQGATGAAQPNQNAGQQALTALSGVFQVSMLQIANYELAFRTSNPGLAYALQHRHKIRCQ
jgi:hypothetical protein